MFAAEPERSSTERREALKRVLAQARGCTRCPELAATRKTVVFGAGNADADLMFVGEAPGASEDEQGVPFVGRAGKLLETLLAEIGLGRADVFIANTLKCLRYDVPVQLGDGSWERIDRLVHSRYDGDVISVSVAGELVRRQVTGWHATPLGGRRVFRLRHRSGDDVAGTGPLGIHLTGDHPVLTERGYVAVAELSSGDRIATGRGLGSDRGARLDRAARVVHYDDVEAEDITGGERADATFFCIDVQDTQNFMTAGGVVHNCRPPGNRDPLPIEISNCQDYLLRQVELIEPTVICTLGNFSTKLLRGDPTGITRLHGQPEVIVLGRRAVRLYPIYHPAAALYTPRMLETLREDFTRLPALLAQGAPEQPPSEAAPELAEEPGRAQPEPIAGREDGSAAGDDGEQLGLF